jgi:tRNA pseudouridine32 synthase/23S rRNA pseudouridine746 synthase
MPPNENNHADSLHFESHIAISSADKTALQHLAENTPLSRQKLKAAMKNGCVWLESSIGINRLRRAKKILKTNDILHIYYDAKIQQSTPPAAKLVADEGEYSIWNKPGGMYSQGSKWGDHCTIYRWAEQHLTPQRPAFLVHRLDRAASGLIILAHTKKAAAAFARLFQTGGIEKHYIAMVEGTLNPQTLPYIISSEIDGKPALSRILEVQALENDRTMVRIEIETGRNHQIRKHLSEAGFPIVGDRLYGTKQPKDLPMENLQLQSIYLKFNCPLTNVKREYAINT